MGATNYVVLVCVSCLLMLTSCQQLVNQHNAIFVFGDSLFDSGNNDYINTPIRANYWPYGMSYFYPPTGRFTDGRTIPDFIAEYARLPLIPTYLDPRNNEFGYGANFASGGSGALVETSRGYAIDLKTQLRYLSDLAKNYRQSLGDEQSEKLLSDAVYLFSCGINDYGGPVDAATINQYVEMVIGNLTDVFMGIYKEGGRKIGIVTLPPMACYPGSRASRANFTCNEQIEIITSLHNQKLSEKLQELENQLEGFMYSKFDFNSEIKKRIKNPSKYGLKVADTACCGSGPFRGVGACGHGDYEVCENPSEYLLFDSSHPTEAVCRQLVDMFWNGDSTVTAPVNLKALFGAKGTRSPTSQIEKL